MKSSQTISILTGSLPEKEETYVDIFEAEAQKKEKERIQAELAEDRSIKDAKTTIARLRYIQLGLCLVMLGAYVRLPATAMNIFSPNTLDDALKVNFDIDNSSSNDAFKSFMSELFVEHWALTVLVLGTAICMFLDFLHYWAITTEDKCDLQEKIDDLTTAKDKNADKARLKAEESTAMLTRFKTATAANLKKKHDDVIRIIENDFLIKELLIRSDIDRDALLKELREKGENANIAEILEKLSIDVSLKNYQNSHEDFQTLSRAIEYVQAIKVPLRYTSLLLLLNHKAFEYPDISSWTETRPIQESEPVYEWLLAGWIILLPLTTYAYYLEFEKNDTITKFDKKTRVIKNTHHNALLSTLLLALDRKTKPKEGTIVPPPDTTKAAPEETLFGMPIRRAIWGKLIISSLCLGSLGRRPFTIYGVSGEEDTPDSTFDILIGCVAVLIIIDVIYIALQLVEERWKLGNKKDQNDVLDACNAYEKSLEGAINHKPLDDDEKLLETELKNLEPISTSKFKQEHPTLNNVKKFSEQFLCVKFALRAMSVSWAIIQIKAEDEFKQQTIGSMSAPDATMLLAAVVGLIFGLMIQYTNRKRDAVLKPNVETRQYTKNTLLFFRDKQPGQLEVKPRNSPRQG
ncbi:MAG: hypothetical protein ACHQAX_06240 [Gammaproteobacteria bacterium]